MSRPKMLDVDWLHVESCYNNTTVHLVIDGIGIFLTHADTNRLIEELHKALDYPNYGRRIDE
jgi:hypothetical protein